MTPNGRNNRRAGIIGTSGLIDWFGGVLPAPTFDKDEDMNVRQVLLNAGLNVFGADLLAESFLKSPIAKQALEKGDPVRFFLPVRRSDCAEFVGVEISIAAVPVEVTANARLTGAEPVGGASELRR